jgi:hypothetical protein
MSILRALHRESHENTPLSFTDVFEQVEMGDSANFNYHLEKLLDHFVRRVEGGYELRPAGKRVLSALSARIFATGIRMDSFKISGKCFNCGEPLSAEYDGGILSIKCAECDTLHVERSFPPSGIEGRTSDEIARAFDRYTRHRYHLVADGLCPKCTGTIESTVTSISNDSDAGSFRVDHVCRSCNSRMLSATGAVLLSAPDVLRFHADRGVDIHTTPFWHFEWCVNDEYPTVLSTDPLEIRIDIRCSDDEFRVTLDADLSILAAEVIFAPRERTQVEA